MFFSRSLLCAGILLISHGAYASQDQTESECGSFKYWMPSYESNLPHPDDKSPQPTASSSSRFASSQLADATTRQQLSLTIAFNHHYNGKTRNVELNYQSTGKGAPGPINGSIWKGTTECLLCDGTYKFRDFSSKEPCLCDRAHYLLGWIDESEVKPCNKIHDDKGWVDTPYCPACKETCVKKHIKYNMYGPKRDDVELYRAEDAPTHLRAVAPEGARWFLAITRHGRTDMVDILVYCPPADGSGTDDLPRSDPSHWKQIMYSMTLEALQRGDEFFVTHYKHEWQPATDDFEALTIEPTM
jgi:hypothetical protein